ncbi:MAG: serine kinase [bacterium]|nr:serine kinase [bacterium]
MLIHGTSVEISGAGLLLRGPPGSGKSDLALRLISECDARLVADDQVDVSLRDGVLVARAPETLAGMIEVRGLGIARLDHHASWPVHLVIELCDSVARFPEPRQTVISGCPLPVWRLRASEASAVAKVVLAVKALQGTVSLDGGFGC